MRRSRHEQIARLEGFGAWLKANGEGIYGTRPWTRFDGKTECGVDVRFTQKPGALYVHLLGTPVSSASSSSPATTCRSRRM